MRKKGPYWKQLLRFSAVALCLVSALPVALTAQAPEQTPSQAATPKLVQAELEAIRKNFKGVGDSSDAIEAASWASIPNMDRLSNMGPAASTQVLGWFQDRKVPEPMRSLLGSEILPTIATEDALPALGKIVADKTESAEIRGAAIASVAAIGGTGATQIIASVAGEHLDNTAMQVSVIRALGKIGDRKGIPIVTSHLYSQDEYVRVVAARALDDIAVKSRDLAIAKPLIGMITEKNFRHKDAVVYILGRSGHLEAIPQLGKLLRDQKEDGRARRAAIRALGKLGGHDAVGILTGVIQDGNEKDEAIRALSAEAAVDAGLSPDKSALLKDVLQSTKDSYLRGRLNEAISRLGVKK